MLSDLSELPVLNLPRADLRVTTDKRGRFTVWDSLRGRYVVITPEEWVRQNFVEMLVGVKGYLRGRVANEITVNLNGTRRRCDTVVFDSLGRPLVIVEYKAPTVTITQQVFDQIARYNMVLQARFLIVSNGLNHYCCRMNYATGGYDFLRDIPSGSEAELNQ